jgi:hypothetical protein
LAAFAAPDFVGREVTNDARYTTTFETRRIRIAWTSPREATLSCCTATSDDGTRTAGSTTS